MTLSEEREDSRSSRYRPEEIVNNFRAGEGIRTPDVNLGKVALYH